MDSDPLVPHEVSPTKKYLMLGTVALLAIYLVVTMIILIVKGHAYSHIGLYIQAVSLLLLSVVIVLVNLWMPQDYMENKAKYSLLALNLCLFLVATGMLVHAFQHTPYVCPPENHCVISSLVEGTWAQRPDCFPAERNATFVAVSSNKTCPPPPPDPTPPPITWIQH